MDSSNTSPPAEGSAGSRREEAIHDFTAKLGQPDILPVVVEYVAWRRALAAARESGAADPRTPDLVPVSINLDLTLACNYKCDHCIDWDILNGPDKHAHDELCGSMRLMAEKGEGRWVDPRFSAHHPACDTPSQAPRRLRPRSRPTRMRRKS